MSDPAKTLAAIQEKSGLIAKQQRRANQGKFKDYGAAIGLQRLRLARKELMAALPPFRVATIDGVYQPMIPRSTHRRLYLDLDGVMADFDAHFPALFGVDHRNLLDDAMWDKINSHPSYFRDMPMCAGAARFFELVRHLNPIILTACPKSDYPHVAQQKKAWVREHLSADLTVLPVMGGRHKALFMHRAGDVLIDDYDRNCDVWDAAGGRSIRHVNFVKTLVELEDALK